MTATTWGLISYGKVIEQGRKGEAQHVRDELVAWGHDRADVRVARTSPPSRAVERARAQFPGW